MTPSKTARTPARALYRVGGTVTGTTYVAPEDRGRERPVEFTGQVVQVGSGWSGVDAETAYLWARLASGQEVKALIGDVSKVT